MFEKLQSNIEATTGFKMLIYGDYGTGKTSFAESYPGTVYLIDFENGSQQYASVFDNVLAMKCNSWKEMLNGIKWVKENGAPEACVIVDSETLLWDSLQYERAEFESKGRVEVKALNLADWGVVKKIVKNLHQNLISLPQSIIAIAHEKKTANSEGYVSGYEPASESHVPYYFDLVLRFTKDFEDNRKLHVVKRRGELLAKSEYDISGKTFFDIFQRDLNLKSTPEVIARNFVVKIMFARTIKQLQEIVEEVKSAALAKEDIEKIKANIKTKMELLK